MTGFLLCLVGLAVMYAAYVRHLSRSGLREALRDAGVNFRRITKAIAEIDRKMFHLTGLLIPLVYQVMLDYGYTQGQVSNVCITLTIAGWLFDITRLLVPAVQEAFLTTPIGRIMRSKEHTQLTGACYFSLGCTMVIYSFEPALAMTSILFLILGDMSAAIVGRSFGGETVALKLGREGKKSAEGSIAMFAVCFVIGCFMFAGVHLREYAVFFAALTATLTELYEPFGLNDNLTIPLFSSCALAWGLRRTASCLSELDM